MKKPPCKKNGTDCPKRQPGCQDHCPEIKAWYAEIDSHKEKKQAHQDANCATVDGRRRLKRLKSQAAKSAIRGEKK